MPPHTQLGGKNHHQLMEIQAWANKMGTGFHLIAISVILLLFYMCVLAEEGNTATQSPSQGHPQMGKEGLHRTSGEF